MAENHIRPKFAGTHPNIIVEECPDSPNFVDDLYDILATSRQHPNLEKEGSVSVPLLVP